MPKEEFTTYFFSRSNRFEFDFTGKYMLCMLAQGTLSFLITLLIQYKVFLRIQRSISALILGPETVKSNPNQDEQDEDVKNETDR